MKIKDSVKQFAQKAMAEAKVDIDINHVKEPATQYTNHQTDAGLVNLFNSKSNKAAFDFLTRNR